MEFDIGGLVVSGRQWSKMRIDISFVFGLLLIFQVYDFVTLGIGMCLILLSDFLLKFGDIMLLEWTIEA